MNNGPEGRIAILAEMCLRVLTVDLVGAMGGFDWSFGEVTSAHLASRDYLGAALPVLNPSQVARLSRLAAESPLVAVIGVVTDPFGALTHQAIEAGATCVLNTLIPAERSVAALAALLIPRAERTASAVGGLPVRHDVAAPFSDTALSDQDTLLVKLVCAGMTTVDLSTHFYCSERSMYRRLRELYDRLAVANRRELRELVVRRADIADPNWQPRLVVRPC